MNDNIKPRQGEEITKNSEEQLHLDIVITGERLSTEKKKVKPSVRTPGTKTCPNCSHVMAAACAVCPGKGCEHTFRQKKTKTSRSGRRGRKVCPQCNSENAAAIASCKLCGHKFREKMEEKIKKSMDTKINRHSVHSSGKKRNLAVKYFEKKFLNWSV